MAQYSKVVWSEGVYLSPQHFQQSDRYFESKINHLRQVGTAHYYGYTKLEIDEAYLLQGQIRISSLEAVFDDGTLFSPTPTQLAHLSYTVPPNTEPSILYLVVSSLSSDTVEVSFDEDDASVNTASQGTTRHKSTHSRYLAFEQQVSDTTDLSLLQRQVSLARLNVMLMLGGSVSANASKLPLAIVSSNDTAQVYIDKSYIPPMLSAQDNHLLTSYINELYGLLQQKTKSLSGAVSDPNRGGAVEMSDFLMLQTVNRYLAYMLHQKEGAKITHPEPLFIELSKLCADLMTFLPTRKMGDMPIYDHNNLSSCYQRLMANLRISLSTILEQRIVRIDLSKRDNATYVAQTPNKQLLDTALFVLAAKADLSSEVLRTRLPNIMKISTVEKISELVAYHLPGVKLHPLSVAPRDLPYHNDYVYFELDKDEEYWDLFDDTSGMAFHVAGDFPNIDLEFWAIKSAT